MQVKLTTLLIAVGAAAATSGCGESNPFGPALINRDQFPVVYAMNGTAAVLPWAIGIRSGTVVLPSDAAVFNFDVAFDINADNAVVIYTVRALGSGVLASLPRVGMQKSNLPFEQVASAPGSGFVYDSSLAVPVGQTVIFDKIEGTCAQFGGGFLGFNIRAKMVIDSVNLSRRAIYLHMLSNPNCGFRSLLPGEPKE